MNENIDLTKILKDCPKGTKFYSSICGEVYFKEIHSDNEYAIITTTNSDFNPIVPTFTKEGFYYDDIGAECLLFPSKDQRDWSKFTAPWYKKERFDPKTMKPFDKVLVRDSRTCAWRCTFYSHTSKDKTIWKYITGNSAYEYCIPYNDETKHLVGTTEEAPEFYRYWEECK